METLTNRSMGQFLERGRASPNIHTESVDVQRLLSESMQLSQRNKVALKLSIKLCVFKNRFLQMCFYTHKQALSKHVR